ncbi:hypothetical protein B0H14DRAFT_2340340, partial [Mycena olivaceomarginata]
DTRQELVVSFRGSISLAESKDIDVFLVPYVSLGISKSFNVHLAFLAAYNHVVDPLLAVVKAQVSRFPKYTVVVTGLPSASTVFSEVRLGYNI